jgi:hypothetical protein
MRNRLILISILWLSASAFAQTTTITGTINDLTNNPVTSGKVVFTLKPSVDTTISGNARFTPGQPVTCYVQSNGTLLNAAQTGPCTVISNTALTPAGTSYRVDLCPYNACSSSFNFYAINSSYNISTIVPTPTTGPAQNFADVFSNQTIAGNKTFSGTTNLAGTALVSLNNMQYASKFAGADASCKIAAAITALPANGHVVDARDLSDSGGTGACVVDPGTTKIVTILLGPYNYFFSSVVVRAGMAVIGFQSPGGDGIGTSITSTNTSGPLFAFPSSGNANGPAVNTTFKSFRVFGPGNTTGCTSQTPSATTDAFFFDTNVTSTSGIWYSRFEDLQICGFSGVGFHFKGNAGGSAGTNQFITFINVVGVRTIGGASAVKIEGAAYQFHFINCQFDANKLNASVDGSAPPNIFLGGVAGGGLATPYIIKFDGLTSQGALTAVQIDGASNVSFQHSHHEADCGVYLVTYGVNGANAPTDGLVIEDSSFNGNTGIGTVTNCAGAGTGYLLKTTTTKARGIVFSNNVYVGTNLGAGPDQFTWANPSGAEIVAKDNEITTVGNWNGTSQTGSLFTQGMSLVLTAANSIVTGHTHHAILTGATAIQNIVSTLAPGEQITFVANGSVSFTAGGNLGLDSHPSVFLNAGDTASFVRQDASLTVAGAWQLVAMTSGADGGMAKHHRFGTSCSTTNVAGNACTTTFSWTTAFPDASYTPVCYGVAPSGSPILTMSTNQIAASITVQVQAATAVVSNFGGVDCTATHD